MREAGQRVKPKLSRYAVASIIQTFRLENRYVFNLSTLDCIVAHHSASWQSYDIGSIPLSELLDDLLRVEGNVC